MAADGEARLFDARENLARGAGLHGVGLDDGERSLGVHIRAILQRRPRDPESE